MKIQLLLKQYFDEFAALLFLILATSMSVKIEPFELLHDFTREYEHNQLDELFLFLVILSLVMSWYVSRKYQRSKLHAQALLDSYNTDTMTQLPNRNAFRRSYYEESNSRSRYLVVMNVINFQNVNHFFGITNADRTMTDLAQKLEEIVRFVAKQQLYRLYGDEFAFFITDSPERVATLCKQIQQLFERTPFIINDTRFHLGINIAYSNEKPKFQTALLAMKHAKESVHSSIVPFESTMNQAKAISENLNVMTLLSSAKKNNHFIAFFQPIIDSRNGDIAIYEALIRIKNIHTVVCASTFLPLSKKFKYYFHITKVIIQKSFETFAHRRELFSINLSYLDIHCGETLSYLFRVVRENPQTASRLIIELVENDQSPESDQKILAFRERLEYHNIKFAIDDFGSGGSHLNQIIELRPHYIKIDPLLIHNMLNDSKAEGMVRTIVRFTKKEGIKTIAEHVNTQELYEKTVSLGIDYAQGYHLGEPIEL